jgi:hypothetical protein
MGFWFVSPFSPSIVLFYFIQYIFRVVVASLFGGKRERGKMRN